MIGASLLLAIALAHATIALARGAAGEVVPLRITPDRVALGERVLAVVELDAAPGAELRFAAPPKLDPALALLDRRLEPATASRPRATMTLALIACGGGDFTVGPFALELRGESGGARRLETTSGAVTITTPWQDDEPPPFPAWRRPAARRGGWIAAGGAAAALIVLVGWIALLRRRRLRESRPTAAAPDRSPRPLRPTRDEWLGLLASELGGDVESRRRVCLEVSRLLRAELAARAPTADFAWTREELVVAQGLGAWRPADVPEWARRLVALERGLFARESIADPRTSVGAPLFELLGRADRLGRSGP